MRQFVESRNQTLTMTNVTQNVGQLYLSSGKFRYIRSNYINMNCYKSSHYNYHLIYSCPYEQLVGSFCVFRHTYFLFVWKMIETNESSTNEIVPFFRSIEWHHTCSKFEDVTSIFLLLYLLCAWHLRLTFHQNQWTDRMIPYATLWAITIIK